MYIFYIRNHHRQLLRSRVVGIEVVVVGIELVEVGVAVEVATSLILGE